ncbi:MAG TPA: homocysteine S-methyltransferase family protein [Clostridia bacterium]|nr:homocysteine S-methyltransferase family protein [Clostridia bacterium]
MVTFLHQDLESAFARHRTLLTEGAVGQRMEREYGLFPDPDIQIAALPYRAEGRRALSEVYRQYLRIAQDYALPMLLMTNTRRANRERVLRSAYRGQNAMRDYASFLKDLASGFSCEAYVGGIMGCKGDAYRGDEGLSFEEAVAFHAWQTDRFREAAIDFLFAGIMPAKEEAMGMAKVLADVGKPYIISLMIRRDGRLLDGTSIREAILAIDGVTDRKPLCYMSNCVHPDIVREALAQPINRDEAVRIRFCGIQANAACFDPEQLDCSPELRTSGAAEWTDAMMALHQAFPLKIFGGCCGTDRTHIEALAKRLTAGI